MMVALIVAGAFFFLIFAGAFIKAMSDIAEREERQLREAARVIDPPVAEPGTLEARHANLKAALARIAGGRPAATLEEELLRVHLHLAQRAAQVALEIDEEESASG